MLTIDIEFLGLDEGARLLIRRALADLPVGDALEVRGTAAEWDLHLRAWCRQQGHTVETRVLPDGGRQAIVSRGPWAEGRWRDAMSTGQSQLAVG